MSNLERLEAIIDAVDRFHAQLVLENQNTFADKLAETREDLFWLYKDMSELDE